jgi:hypothetical protein
MPGRGDRGVRTRASALMVLRTVGGRCVSSHARTRARQARARARAQPKLPANACACLPHREDPSWILPLAMPKKNLLGTSVGCRGTGTSSAFGALHPSRDSDRGTTSMHASRHSPAFWHECFGISKQFSLEIDTPASCRGITEKWITHGASAWRALICGGVAGYTLRTKVYPAAWL